MNERRQCIPLLIVLLIQQVNSLPALPSTIVSNGTKPVVDSSVGRLAFTLAEPDAVTVGEGATPPTGTSFIDFIQAVTKSTLFQKVIQYFGSVVTGQGGETSKKPFVVRTPQADIVSGATSDNVRREFEASLSHDEAVERVPSGASIAAAAPTHKITDEAWSGMLFGDQGVLTNVFNMMDAQRKNDMATMAQADPSFAKVKDLDFTKIFDSLVMGGQQNQFGEPGPELPEFLGICNRLSCGDIYKAIDEFRRSEFFSNFQTALQLVQDPKGWEILGKLLSNPEMIAQFTGGSAGGAAGGAAGGGIVEMLGSALGGAKSEAERGESLSATDGDFGTDFSSLEKNDKGEKPEVSFSVDGGEKGDGKGEDYYSHIVKNIDEDFDTDEDLDILGIIEKKEVIPVTQSSSSPSTTTTSASTTTTMTTSTTSSSIPSTTTTESFPIIPPSRPIKKEEVPLPEISFSTDEDYEEGVSFSKNIDAAPPSVTVDKRPPTTVIVDKVPELSPIRPFNSTAIVASRAIMTAGKTQELVIKGGMTIETKETTTTTRTTTQSTTQTTSTVPPSIRPMKRISVTVPPPTTTTRNYRKDSDYYSMYYDG